jgi:hypothetical protein
MKKISLFLLMCLSVSAVTMAQEEPTFSSGREKHDSKPQYFAHLSPKFSVKAGFVNELLQAKLNDPINLMVTEGFVVAGKVIAKNYEGNGVETVTVESNQKKGLLLSVSRYTRPDGSVEFSGVIRSQDIRDMILMEKDPITGNYQWTRKNVSQMITD